MGGVSGVTLLGSTAVSDVVALDGAGGVTPGDGGSAGGTDGFEAVGGGVAGLVVDGCAELLELVDSELQAATNKSRREGQVTRRMGAFLNGFRF